MRHPPPANTMTTGRRFRTVVLCVIALLLLFNAGVGAGEIVEMNQDADTMMWSLIAWAVLSLWLMADFRIFRNALILQFPIAVFCSPFVSIPIWFVTIGIGLLLSPLFQVVRLVWNVLCLIAAPFRRGGCSCLLTVLLLCGGAFHASAAADTGAKRVGQLDIPTLDGKPGNLPAGDTASPYHLPQHPRDLLKPEEQGMTPEDVFMKCIEERDNERVRLFIVSGLDINECRRVSYPECYNALQFAVKEQNFAAVKALVDAGAEVNVPACSSFAGEKDSSLLHFARTVEADWGFNEKYCIYTYLEQHGARMNWTEEFSMEENRSVLAIVLSASAVLGGAFGLLCIVAFRISGRASRVVIICVVMLLFLSATIRFMPELLHFMKS